MSPDLHWHVGEDAEQETIAKTTSPRRSRRSWIAVLIVVILGASLGMAYRSLPEPAPRPTPTPVPTGPATPTRPAMSVALYQTIDREAQALADGDVDTVIALHEPQDAQLTERQRDNFVAWGRPTDDSPMYAIIDFNLRTQTKAWADVRQFRHGRYFRETRFYHRKQDQWRRTADADPAFWGGQVAVLDTPHLHIICAVEDSELIKPMATQLEELYGRLCHDLDCAAPDITYTLNLNYGSNPNYRNSLNKYEIGDTSPRLMGIYEGGPPIARENNLLTWRMAWVMTSDTAYGQPYSLDLRDHDGSIIAWAIVNWAARRVIGFPMDARDLDLLKPFDPNLQQPAPLETLWDYLPGGSTRFSFAQMYDQSCALIIFIEQEYGAQSMPKLLKALGTAQSFSDVIENGLGVSFSEFDQKWQAWLKQTS